MLHPLAIKPGGHATAEFRRPHYQHSTGTSSGLLRPDQGAAARTWWSGVPSPADGREAGGLTGSRALHPGTTAATWPPPGHIMRVAGTAADRPTIALAG